MASLRAACLLIALHAFVLATPIEFIVELPNLSDEVLEPKYQVSVAKHVLAANESATVEGMHRMAMRGADGSELDCYLPIESPAPEPAQEEAKEPPKPSALLEPLHGTCLYRAEEWWTYEVCHRKQVRQFHKQGESVTAEFLLGTFAGNESEADMVQQGGGHPSLATPYVRESYGEGTPCDIASRARSAEVRYICSDDKRTALAAVEETHSCAYRLTVTTPLLCAHPGFRGTEVPVQEIRCYPRVEPEPAEQPLAAEAEGLPREEAEAEGPSGSASQERWNPSKLRILSREEGEEDGEAVVTIEGIAPFEAVEGADLEQLVESIIRLASGEDADADFMGDEDSDESGGKEARKPGRTEL